MASWPPLLLADASAAMLNFEIADHPVYHGLELQWFDDAAHGTGMLAFLGHRDSHVFDYYAQRGLRLDPANYQIGAGTGAWVETDITDALLEISDDGVHAAALFTDVDGRRIEVRIDDRDGRRRRRGELLAPVSAAIESPKSLFLVWLPAFDLVRTGGHPPVLRIGDADLKVGKLPGDGLHRRRLIKYAAPVVSIEVLPEPRSDGPADVQPPGPARDGVAEAAVDGGTVGLAFHPPLPDLTALPDGARRDGSWSVSADTGRLTGGGGAPNATVTRCTPGSTSRSTGDRGAFRSSCGWSPPSSPCSGGGRRRTGGGQSSVPAARPRVAGRGSAPHMATTIVGPPAPDQSRTWLPWCSPATTAQKTQSVSVSMQNNAHPQDRACPGRVPSMNGRTGCPFGGTVPESRLASAGGGCAGDTANR